MTKKLRKTLIERSSTAKMLGGPRVGKLMEEKDLKFIFSFHSYLTERRKRTTLWEPVPKNIWELKHDIMLVLGHPVKGHSPNFERAEEIANEYFISIKNVAKETITMLIEHGSVSALETAKKIAERYDLKKELGCVEEHIERRDTKSRSRINPFRFELFPTK